MKKYNRGFAVGIIVALVAVLALGGVGTWYATSKKANTKIEVKTTEGDQVVVGATSTLKVKTTAPNSLESALALGGSYTCTFTIKDPNTESSGTYYIDNKKIRGDFTSSSKIAAQTVQSHTIIDGGFSYTWTDLSPTMGFKVPAQITADGKIPVAPVAAQAQLNLNGANANYACVPWTADATKFSLPASVKFVEMPSAR